MISPKAQKLPKIIAIIFIVSGVLQLIAAGWFGINRLGMINDSSKIEGVVVDHHRKSSDSGGSIYALVVEYEYLAEKRQFRSDLYSNSPTSIGTKVDLYIDPKNPDEVLIEDFIEIWFPTLILSLLGLIFTVFGSFFFYVFGIRRILNSRKKAKLLNHGLKIQAKYAGCHLNESFSFNDVHPYYLKAQWLDQSRNELHVFHSENIWYDPSDYVGDREYLDVYIDGNDPKTYHLDISFLPKLA